MPTEVRLQSLVCSLTSALRRAQASLLQRRQRMLDMPGASTTSAASSFLPLPEDYSDRLFDAPDDEEDIQVLRLQVPLLELARASKAHRQPATPTPNLMR